MELVLQSQIFKFYSDFIGRKSREILFDKIGKEEIMDFFDEFNDKPILKVNYYNALNAFYKFNYDTQRTSDVMKDVPRPLPPVIEPPKYIEENDIILLEDFIKNILIYRLGSVHVYIIYVIGN